MKTINLENLSHAEIDKLENTDTEDDDEEEEQEQELTEKYQQQFIVDLYEYSRYFDKYCNEHGLLIGESLIVNDFFELILNKIK